MDVGATTLRAELKHYLDLVRAGEEIVITERNVPIARITPIDSASTIEELTRQGLIAPPTRLTRQRASRLTRAKATGPVADLVSDQRR
jgi:prevent-host-death family protein